MGGCVIEKHITLSKQDGGLDDPIALTEHEFTEMVQAVRRAEKNRESAEAELKTKYGLQRVERVFGTGEKAFAPCEAVNYSTTRRSILARKDIKKGEPFSDENVALLRSEKNLIPGLHPKYFSEVLGAKARRNIPSGRGIKLGDF
jgi:N-acetylneuraminate synthase